MGWSAWQVLTALNSMGAPKKTFSNATEGAPLQAYINETSPFYFLSSHGYLSRRSQTYRLASENHDLSIFHPQWIKLDFIFSVGFVIIAQMSHGQDSYTSASLSSVWLWTSSLFWVSILPNCKMELEEELNFWNVKHLAQCLVQINDNCCFSFFYYYYYCFYSKGLIF